MAEILSVGIDIGTSTTQVIFSRLRMENTSGYFSVPKVSIVEKEVVYKSRVYTTPLLSPYFYPQTSQKVFDFTFWRFTLYE